MNSKANGSGAHTCDTMMRDALLHALQQQVAFDGCIMSKMQAIADQLVAKALAGDMRAIKEVFDRIDGKARPATVAREQPTEAQAGIGLKEQLRRLTAWDFPPPPAAVAPEQPMEAQSRHRIDPTGKPSSHTGCSPGNCRAVRSREELPR